MRRPENYYYIILLNKNKNVQVMLLVRFLFIKKKIFIPCLNRDFNVQNEVREEGRLAIVFL